MVLRPQFLRETSETRNSFRKTVGLAKEIFFEFLRNIFFGQELVKDKDITQNDGFGLVKWILKNHVFGSTVSSFDFGAPRPF